MLISRIEKQKISYIKDLFRFYPFAYRKSLHLSHDFTFGCEVEMNHITISDAESMLYFTSLTGYKVVSETTASAELVTPIMKDDPSAWNEFAMILQYLVQFGATIDENTAGHIHIGTHMIDTPKKVKCLLKVLALFHPILFRFGYGYEDKHRSFMTYHNPFQFNYATVNDFGLVDTFLSRDYKNLDDFISAFGNLTNSRVDSKNAFNFLPFDIFHLKDETHHEPSLLNHMEFRHPNGSLDPKIWQNNIMLLGTIIDKIGTEQIDFYAIDRLYALYHKTHWKMIRQYVKDPKKYDEYLHIINSINMSLASQFATIFFPCTKDQAYFWRGYLKVYQEEDIKKLTFLL